MSGSTAFVNALTENIPALVIAALGVVGFTAAYLAEWGGTSALLLTAILAIGGIGYAVYYTRQNYRTRRITE